MVLCRSEPDGNCMFTSIAHQLALPSTTKSNAATIRQLAVSHILDNPNLYRSEIYLDFVDNPRRYSGVELNTEDLVSKGVYFKDDFRAAEAYCRALGESGHWGDSASIMAVARALNVRICVFSEVVGTSRPPAQVFGEGSRMLRICFRPWSGVVRNHYDSVLQCK